MDKCKVESYNKCHICKKIKKLNVWFSINRSIDYMDKIDDSLYNKHTDYNIYFCSVNCMKIYRYNINKETKSYICVTSKNLPFGIKPLLLNMIFTSHRIIY